MASLVLVINCSKQRALKNESRLIVVTQVFGQVENHTVEVSPDCANAMMLTGDAKLDYGCAVPLAINSATRNIDYSSCSCWNGEKEKKSIMKLGLHGEKGKINLLEIPDTTAASSEKGPCH